MIAFALSVLWSTASIADHVDSGAYPYVTEITVDLLAQEKLYAAAPSPALTYNEKNTTRIVRYKFWASGILSVQNDPPDGGPHGPLKDIGLMVHEAGINRIGKSIVKLSSDHGKPVLVLDQDTQLVRKSGEATPGVRLKAHLPVRLWSGTLGDFSKREQVTLDLATGGEQALLHAVEGMLRSIYQQRRAEVAAGLEENGLELDLQTLTFRAEIIGQRKFKAVFDNTLKLARLRLPDMRVHIRAEISQSYE